MSNTNIEKYRYTDKVYNHGLFRTKYEIQSDHASFDEYWKWCDDLLVMFALNAHRKDEFLFL